MSAQDDRPWLGPVGPVVSRVALFVCAFALFGLVRHWVISGNAMGERVARCFTGDEPQYCLIAHSLVHDGDIAVDNNLAQGDYRRFHPHHMSGHTWHKTIGERYSSHRIGLPLLIALPYAVGEWTHLGERFMVCVFINLVGAAVVLLMFELGWLVTRRAWASLGAALTLGFTLPLMAYGAYEIYPDLPAGLLVALAVWLLLRGKAVTAATALGVSACVGFLPWLHEKFIVAAVVLAVWLGVKGRLRLRVTVPLAALGAVSLALQCWHYMVLYGTIFPMVGRHADAFDHFEFFKGLVGGMPGMVFDRGFGLLAQSPVYAIVPIGLFLLWRRERRAAVWLLALFASVYLVVGFYVGWWWSRSPAPRHIVAVLPLLAVPMAAAYGWAERRVFRIVAAVLVVASVVIAVYAADHPEQLFVSRRTFRRGDMGYHPLYPLVAGSERWRGWYAALPSYAWHSFGKHRTTDYVWTAVGLVAIGLFTFVTLRGTAPGPAGAAQVGGERLGEQGDGGGGGGTEPA